MPGNTNMKQSYEADIIICGGGGAGCLIAAKLAELLPDLDILLVEQGRDNRDSSRLSNPLDSLFWLFQDNPYLKWIESEPQANLDGRRSRIPVGNILGGGTSVNTVMYNTAAPSDFDEWHQPGWSFSDLEPLIKKPTSAGDSVHDVHSRSGSFEVTSGGHEMKWGDDLHAAFTELIDIPKVNILTDYKMVPKLIGKDGRRSNTADTYLHSSQARNLQVLTNTTVVRVIIEQGKATGVELIIGTPNRDPFPHTPSKDEPRPGGKVQSDNTRDVGETQNRVKPQTSKTIKARKLVILCCGALGTPGVLERSGVGNPDILRAAGIDVLVNLPGVGADLDDHQLTVSCYRTKDDYETFDDYARGVEAIKKAADEEWRRTGKGMAATNGFDWGYKIRPTAQDISAIGDVFKKYCLDEKANKETKTLYSAVMIPYFYASQPRPETGRYFSVGGFHNYPASRGSIHITSPDPFAPPKLDVGLLNHPADLPVHVWHYKLQREVMRRLPFFVEEVASTHPQFSSDSSACLISSSTTRKSPVRGERIKYTSEDDRAIEDWVKKNVATAYHSISTCAMRRRDQGGVVSPTLDVYGVEGLKVADLSICSGNVGANTASVVLLIAEKATQLIAEQLREKISAKL